MPFAYGYILGSLGVDGDPVDCFLGPNPAAPTCFLVPARRWGGWKEYDEDKLMLGFDSEDDARRAFLLSYSDPRFFGPIVPMPVAELRARLKASRGQMLKARVLFFKESR
jgi:hypothetical protein